MIEPTDDSDAVTDEECAEILKVVTINFLSGLYSSEAKHYFKSKDGKYSVDKQTPDMIRRMEGFLRTNDKGGERPIGTFKCVYENMVNIGWLAANAVATARATRTFAIAAASSSDRGAYKDKAGSGAARKQPAAAVNGSFVALPERESDGLVRAARRELTEKKRSLKRTLAAQQERWAELAKAKREGDLSSIKAKFKNATIYHKKWVETYCLVTTPVLFRKAVHAIPRKGKRLAFLKDYCKVGEHGLGFVEKGTLSTRHSRRRATKAPGRRRISRPTAQLSCCLRFVRTPVTSLRRHPFLRSQFGTYPRSAARRSSALRFKHDASLELLRCARNGRAKSRTSSRLVKQLPGHERAARLRSPLSWIKR